MIHLFVHENAIKLLATRDFIPNTATRNDWLVDITEIPWTICVEYDQIKKEYSVQQSIRDDKGDWENHKTENRITDINLIEADNVQQLLDMVRNEQELKSMFLGFLLARQAENYLHECNFWSIREKPDEIKGGVLIFADEGVLSAKVVYGKDRPDMMCVPYKVHYHKDMGNVIESEEPEMGRPYYDEFLNRLSGKFENKMYDDADVEKNKEMSEDELKSEEEFVNKIGSIFGRLEDLNAVLNLGIEPDFEAKDLTFAIEIIDMPYTMVYSPANDITRKIASSINGLPGIEEADALLLFFERTVMGCTDSRIKAAMTIKHGKEGSIQGGSSDQNLNNNSLGAFFHFTAVFNTFLNGEKIYSEYQNLNKETSGMMLSVKNGGIETKIVSGKDRPDLECVDALNLQYIFASDKPIVTARPYIDEIAAGIRRSSMSLTEKIEAAENGDTECMEDLVRLYLDGDEETTADPEKCVYWSKKMANAGSAIGMFNLGLYLAKGFGIERNFEKAAYWMEKAAEAGDEDAAKIAELYRKLVDITAKAEMGDAQAQASLADELMKLGGSLVQAGPGKDYEECVKWARKAVAQGNTDALWTLALAYHHGRGVEKNIETAIMYYQRGAELGNPACMHNLACEYLSGENIWKNRNRGFELLKKAAAAGNGLAMKDLGHCYQFGIGCMGNMKTATEWYEKAAQVIDDPEVEQKAAAFKMLSESDPHWGENYCGEADDEYEGLTLQGTQYEGRAERCEKLQVGKELEYKITKDKNGEETLEMLYNGASVGLLAPFAVENVIKFLKKDKITLTAIVTSCIPKSKRGPRARNADVQLKLVINEKKTETPEERAAREKAERIAAEKAKREAEEQRKREQEEEERKAAEEKAKKDREEAEKKQYETDLENWKNDCKRIKDLREEKIKERLSEERKKLENAAIGKYEMQKAASNRKIEEAEKKKTEAERILSELGFFKFGEKSNQKKAIKEAEVSIALEREALSKNETEYRDSLEKAKRAEKEKEREIRRKTEKEYPLPQEPKAPEYLRQDPKKSENDEIKEQIRDVASCIGRFNIDGLMRCLSTEVSVQRVSAIVRQMVADGELVREEINRKAYFSAPEK